MSSSKLLLKTLIGFDSTVPFAQKGDDSCLGGGLSSQITFAYYSLRTRALLGVSTPLYQLGVLRLEFIESSASNQLNPYCLQGQKHKSLTPLTPRLLLLVWTGSVAISRKCKQHQGLGDLGQA